MVAGRASNDRDVVHDGGDAARGDASDGEHGYDGAAEGAAQRVAHSHAIHGGVRTRHEVPTEERLVTRGLPV